MRQHHAFRLAISLVHGLHPEVDVATAIADRTPAEGTEDPVRKILESSPDAAYFGRFWNEQLTRGFRQLQFLDADQYMEIRFEDLITDPVATLTRLAEFFELPGRDWINRSAALVRGMPESRLQKLPEDEQVRLTEACLAGNQLLGRA